MFSRFTSLQDRFFPDPVVDDPRPPDVEVEPPDPPAMDLLSLPFADERRPSTSSLGIGGSSRLAVERVKSRFSDFEGIWLICLLQKMKNTSLF